MTLTDAGPLVAILDAGEPDHDACMATLDTVELPLLTTWPAFSEAMSLAARAGGIMINVPCGGCFTRTGWSWPTCRRRLSTVASG